MNRIAARMKSYARVGAIICALVIFISLAGISQRARGQQTGGGPGPGRGGTDSLGDLRFRNLGPAVAGGRVAAVAGVPGNPNIIYVGAAGGGMWKTIDGGITWRAIWDNMPTASIGAIAVAPQNPN